MVLKTGRFWIAMGQAEPLGAKMRKALHSGRVIAVWLGLAIVLAACDQPIKLAPAPTLYRVGAAFPADEVPLAFRSVDPAILYLTDRQPEIVDGALVGYGYGRSDSMALGRARVRFGDIDSWPALVARSQSGATRAQNLFTDGYEEIVRFPDTPIPERRIAGDLVRHPAIVQDYAESIMALQGAVTAQLRLSQRREVIIYVHGFNNELQDGITTTASLWHYAGRIGVPISYSWL